MVTPPSASPGIAPGPGPHQIGGAAVPPPVTRHKPMMRQYELVERVAQYNDDVDEARLVRLPSSKATGPMGPDMPALVIDRSLAAMTSVRVLE